MAEQPFYLPDSCPHIQELLQLFYCSFGCLHFNSVDTAKKEGRAEGRAEGLKEGHEKGIAEGEQRKNLENARNFKALGVSVDIIMKATGLTIEEIEKL